MPCRRDRQGHKAGDTLLKHFASLLLKCFRDADVVARMGGDEFAVFMAGADAQSSIALKRMDKLAVADGCLVKRELRWSAGTVTFDPERHQSVSELLDAADAAMYECKSASRPTS
jgi:diguanylate cyclase (GGDEF)-like protein